MIKEKKKHVLYSLFWGEYLPSVLQKCNVCGKMFQVKKGFALSEGGDTLICYKHLNEENLIK